MNTYQLRRGTETVGLYDEPQLEDLWEDGKLAPDLTACQEPDGEWITLSAMMSRIAERKRTEAQQDRWRQQRLAYAAQGFSEFSRQRRSPVLAALMSLFVPGAGHLYAQASILGVLWIVGTIVTATILVVNHAHASSIVGSYFSWGIISGIFAYISTGRANQRLRKSLQL